MAQDSPFIPFCQFALGCSLAPLLVASCASYAQRTTAKPVSEGEWKTSLAIDALVIERGQEYQVLPLPEVTVRSGRAGRDYGMSLGAGNLEFFSTIALRDSGKLALALAPHASVAFQILTNNRNDLLRGTTGAALLAEVPWKSRISLFGDIGLDFTLAGPAIAFRGRTDGLRVLLEPHLGIGLRFQMDNWSIRPNLRATWPNELGASFDQPIFQGGLAFDL